MVWPAVTTFWYWHTCWLLENVSYMNKSWKDLCLGTVQLVLCFVTPTITETSCNDMHKTACERKNVRYENHTKH